MEIIRWNICGAEAVWIAKAINFCESRMINCFTILSITSAFAVNGDKINWYLNKRREKNKCLMFQLLNFCKYLWDVGGYFNFADIYIFFFFTIFLLAGTDSGSVPDNYRLLGSMKTIFSLLLRWTSEKEVT